MGCGAHHDDSYGGFTVYEEDISRSGALPTLGEHHLLDDVGGAGLNVFGRNDDELHLAAHPVDPASVRPQFGQETLRVRLALAPYKTHVEAWARPYITRFHLEHRPSRLYLFVLMRDIASARLAGLL